MQCFKGGSSYQVHSSNYYIFTHELSAILLVINLDERGKSKSYNVHTYEILHNMLLIWEATTLPPPTPTIAEVEAMVST